MEASLRFFLLSQLLSYDAVEYHFELQRNSGLSDSVTFRDKNMSCLRTPDSLLIPLVVTV